MIIFSDFRGKIHKNKAKESFSFYFFLLDWSVTKIADGTL